MKEQFLNLLKCPSCQGRLSLVTDVGASKALCCQRCGRRTPIQNGIPRFVGDESRPESTDLARRTRASFGYEWSHFNDWHPSGRENFADYFSHFDLESLRGRTVLDGGCGMGRHA